MVREGPRTLFQGFSATTLRDAPYAGMYLMLYEVIKSRLGMWLDSLGRVFVYRAFGLPDLVGVVVSLMDGELTPATGDSECNRAEQ